MGDIHGETSKKAMGKRTLRFIAILFPLVFLTAGMIPEASHARVGDPEIIWNTFMGSPGMDRSYAYTAKIDQSGNLHVTGHSDGSWGTPVNAHTGGAEDVFAAKLDISGNRIWNTFLGGASFDAGHAATVDEDGNMILMGISEGAWTTSGISPYNGDAKDIFVAKLDQNGNLVWHTFLGTTVTSGNITITLDRDGNIYGTGHCIKQFGAPVIRPFQEGGGPDGFVVKLDPDGNIIWSTFLGGPKLDVCLGIAMDKDGMILVGGSSQGTWGNPRHAHSLEGIYDGFVVKLDPDGNIIQHTFIGTVTSVILTDLGVDPFGGVYISGYCEGQWGTAVRNYSGGDWDTFAAKLDRNLDTVWLTYLGSIMDDRGYGIELDQNGYVYVTGGSDEPWGEDPVRPHMGNQTPFIAKLDSNGKLIWHGFYGTPQGGGSYPGHANLSVDGGGNVYFTSDYQPSWGDPIVPISGGIDVCAAVVSDPVAEGTELHALTVQKEGQGSGRVISRPSGIACGGNCTAFFSQETIVTMTAVPDPGFVFDGWKGVRFSGNGPCRFEVDCSMTVTAVFNPDSDGDGISDSVEDEAPNQGDGNGDGLRDAQQGNVASFRDVYERWCTLESETGSRIRGMKVASKAALDGFQPEGMHFNSGFISFRIEDLTPGQSTIPILTLHDKAIITAYWKYGPTEENRESHWYRFIHDGLTGAKIIHEQDRTVIYLHLKDGARGDDDLLENGEIEDMGGPAGNISGCRVTGDSSGCFITTLTGRP